MKGFRGQLTVLALGDKGIQCATVASPDAPFWLPRGSYVTWVCPPQVGGIETATVPGWLAAKHRQLAGDVEYDRVRDERRETAKE
jgi:hypothetical protein